MEETDRKSLTRALPALRQRLDQESKILAAQDFRHIVQKEPEKVADFIRRLERAFHIAYGGDSMGKETREAFLFGQLQDYRGLNEVTRSDTFPLPQIDDLLDQLGGARLFCTLDLASGFWQIRVHPDSQLKTAFITHHGLHEFRVMPFGLKNALAAFQHLMH